MQLFCCNVLAMMLELTSLLSSRCESLRIEWKPFATAKRLSIPFVIAVLCFPEILIKIKCNQSEPYLDRYNIKSLLLENPTT